jgi:hypothetical protein
MPRPWETPGSTVPDWLLRRREISPGAKLVYALLADHTCHPDHADYSIASGIDMRSIAKAIGASERSVRNWVDELETVGLLKVQVLGWGRPNLYWFQEHAWQKAR